ncbi:MAG: hypothetical protein M3Q72_13120, partial [Actinomycetota bacterium]|nr:hypothetical protein [Actinomycetota bacterium]
MTIASFVTSCARCSTIRRVSPVLEHRRAASIASTLDGETILRANLPAVGGAAVSDELARLER